MLHFIGRVESLDSDLEKILARVGGAPLAEREIWAPHGTGANSKLEALYCAESTGIIRSIYAEDFKAFDYSEQPFWLRERGG